ncbi:hypothetical protein JCM5350_007777 [Sporobolomyces pararoseus]
MPRSSKELFKQLGDASQIPLHRTSIAHQHALKDGRQRSTSNSFPSFTIRPSLFSRDIWHRSRPEGDDDLGGMDPLDSQGAYEPEPFPQSIPTPIGSSHSIPVEQVSPALEQFRAAIAASRRSGLNPAEENGCWNWDESAELEEENEQREDEEFQELVNELFVVSLLANLRRHVLSREMLTTFLLFAKILGAPNVPSYHAYMKEMKRIKEEVSNEPKMRKRTGGDGNVYYTKSISAAIERDFLNPRLASTFQFYPRRGEGSKDLFDGDYLNYQLPPSLATPMVRSRDHDFYLFEPVKHQSGALYATQRWFERGSELWGEGYEVELDSGSLKLPLRHMETYRVEELIMDSKELETLASYTVVSDSDDFMAVNPLRIIANGQRVFSTPVSIQMDDLSGARSKRWNPHYAIQFTNATLPRSIRFEESAIRVFTVGHDAQPLELVEGLCEELTEGFEKPREMIYSSENDEKVLVRLYPLFLLGDNVMFSELCSHVGQAGNHPCRSCHVDTPRNAKETLGVIEQQLKAARDDQTTVVQQLQTTTGVADKVAQNVCTILLEANDIKSGKKLPRGPLRNAAKLSDKRRKEEMSDLYEALKDSHNPLLDLAQGPLLFDVHQRTASDLLHGVPLGPVKYLVKATNARLSPQSRDKLQVRLEAASTAGMDCGKSLNVAYMLRHLDSLNGVDIRLLCQTMACSLAPLQNLGTVEKQLFDAWRAAGTLCRFFYFEEIVEDFKETYFVILRAVVSHFTHACAPLMPKSLAHRPKWHLLAHLMPDIRLYGPAKGFATDRHEAFNAIIRNGSVSSNRSAPSLDIGNRMARQEILVHLLDGGKVVDKQGRARTISNDALKVVKNSEKLQEMFGVGGTRKKYGNETSLDLPIGGTEDLEYAQFDRPDLVGVDHTVITVKSYRKLHTKFDSVKVEDFVKCSADGNAFTPDRQTSGIVKINRLCVPVNPSPALAPILREPHAIAQLVEHGGICEQELDPVYKMVKLKLTNHFVILPLWNVICTLNVVHNCVSSKCEVVGSAGKMRKERQILSVTKPALVHTPSSDYILNSSLIRSGHLALELYPQVLPIVTFESIAAVAIEAAKDPKSRDNEADDDRDESL